MSQEVADLFNFTKAPLAEGLKYLGFWLKPAKYIVDDWNWLIIKFRKRFNSCTAKWLSRGGRLILSKAVLQQIIVFWAHLFVFPKNVLKKIGQIMAKFIWGGRSDKKVIHLAKWDDLSLPIDRGGWGILDVEIFGHSLITKTLWQGLHGNGKWHEIIRHKYLGDVIVADLAMSGWPERK